MAKQYKPDLAKWVKPREKNKQKVFAKSKLSKVISKNNLLPSWFGMRLDWSPNWNIVVINVKVMEWFGKFIVLFGFLLVHEIRSESNRTNSRSCDTQPIPEAWISFFPSVKFGVLGMNESKHGEKKKIVGALPQEHRTNWYVTLSIGFQQLWILGWRYKQTKKKKKNQLGSSINIAAMKKVVTDRVRSLHRSTPVCRCKFR
jgi:hypothetical protein